MMNNGESDQVNDVLSDTNKVELEEKLSKEDCLALELYHRNREYISLQSQNITLRLDIIEKDKTLLLQARSTLKSQLLENQREYKKFLDDIKVRTGITVEGRIIDTSTGCIKD